MSRPCVLVSHDPAFRMKLAVALRREGFEVRAARTAVEALMQFGADASCAVICDLEGLGGDAAATLRALRGTRALLMVGLADAPFPPGPIRYVDRKIPAAFIAAQVASWAAETVEAPGGNASLF